MAKLRVLDKVALGEFIIEAAQDTGAIRKELVEEPIKQLSKFVEIPVPRIDPTTGKTITHTIRVLEDTQDLTHMVLPWKKDVDVAMEDIDHQPSIYPNEYRPGSPDFIDDKLFPRKALFFRFGEYMFGRCKHG